MHRLRKPLVQHFPLAVQVRVRGLREAAQLLGHAFQRAVILRHRQLRGLGHLLQALQAHGPFGGEARGRGLRSSSTPRSTVMSASNATTTSHSIDMPIQTFRCGQFVQA